MHIRTLALVAAVLAAVPSVTFAQRGVPPGTTRSFETPGYRSGYDRGVRRGEQDGRDNHRFDFSVIGDYRSGDAGYRREFGDRERYRVQFRFGFEAGYRDGFSRYRAGYGRGEAWRPGAGGPPPWAVARGRGGYQRTDLAFRSGFTDGYEAGLRDGRDRRRFDPAGEGRYRSGDHGYARQYGSRDSYRLRFREAFLEGYRHGYDDGWQYGPRSKARPSWWPW